MGQVPATELMEDISFRSIIDQEFPVPRRTDNLSAMNVTGTDLLIG